MDEPAPPTSEIEPNQIAPDQTTPDQTTPHQTTPDQISPLPIICPNCAESLEIDAQAENAVILCPSCQTEFSLVADEAQQSEIPYPGPADLPDELDGLKIRQLVQLRRSAIRARTYAILVTICCLFMGVQLIFTDIQEVHSYGWDRWAILYAISAAAMAIIATLASRKAGGLHRESKRSPPAIEPEHVPHFDELSDGSQRIKNLEQMRDANANSS